MYGAIGFCSIPKPSNSETDFILKFNQLLMLSDNKKKELQINAKKKIKIFSIFHHFNQLKNIMKNN